MNINRKGFTFEQTAEIIERDYEEVACIIEKEEFRLG